MEHQWELTRISLGATNGREGELIMELRGRKAEIQTKSIKLNLSEREYNKLKALAEQQGLNMSAYIRRECIYKPLQAIIRG